eukprot:g25105.t1
MALVPFVVPEAAVHQSPLVQNADRNWACSLRAASMASQVALGASLFIGASRVRRGKKIARGSIGDSSRNIAVAERSNAERLQQMSARELKHELQIRGVDTQASPDKQLLLELGMESGIFPHSSGGRRRLSRISQVDEPPIVVALKQVTQDADLIPSGAGFTDGERLVCGPRIQQKLSSELDTSLKRSAVRASIAEELGSVGRPCSGLRFASEPVQIVPDDSVVLGPDRANISGLLGVDFLHYFDLDLDLQRGICRAWPSGPALPRGFGLPDAVEIELFQDKGLLLVDAQLRGTVCSGTDTCGPPLRAVLEWAGWEPDEMCIIFVRTGTNSWKELGTIHGNTQLCKCPGKALRCACGD